MIGNDYIDVRALLSDRADRRRTEEASKVLLSPEQLVNQLGTTAYIESLEPSVQL